MCERVCDRQSIFFFFFGAAFKTKETKEQAAQTVPSVEQVKETLLLTLLELSFHPFES